MITHDNTMRTASRWVPDACPTVLGPTETVWTEMVICANIFMEEKTDVEWQISLKISIHLSGSFMWWLWDAECFYPCIQGAVSGLNIFWQRDSWRESCTRLRAQMKQTHTNTDNSLHSLTKWVLCFCHNKFISFSLSISHKHTQIKKQLVLHFCHNKSFWLLSQFCNTTHPLTQSQARFFLSVSIKKLRPNINLFTSHWLSAW